MMLSPHGGGERMERYEMLRATLRRDGLDCAALPAARLADALAVVAAAYRSGDMGGEYRDGSVEELLAVRPPDWCVSLWVVAVPCSLLRYRFTNGAGEKAILLPSMYLYSEPMRRAETAMRTGHEAAGGVSEWAWLPVRILAAAAGMGEFGRNNMLYLPGRGSFPWLTGFFSSLEVPDVWREPARMKRCEHCAACVAACPSGALTRDRRLMRSDRCLNYVTEYPERGGDWYNPRLSRELLGCLACQLACPANREHRDWIEDGPVFSRRETAELAAGGDLSPDLLRRLGGEDLRPYLGGVARRIASLDAAESGF